MALVEPCNRAFADLYEPWVDQNTAAGNIIFIANKLWEVGEHARAANKYELFRTVLDADIELQTFKKDAKPVVDRYGEIISARAEFKKPWEEIADLSWDTPEFRQAYESLPRDKWPAGQKADYFKAKAKLKDFRTKTMAAQKGIIDPAQFKNIEGAVTAFERLLDACVNDTLVASNLAEFYQEDNKFDKALPLLMELYKFDPLSPDYALGVVTVTLRAAVRGEATKEAMIKARAIAVEVRDQKKGTRDKAGYWRASAIVLEFSVMLNELKVVNDSLSFMLRNKTDLSRDLVAPAELGDDKRARRPANDGAVDLAKRFLALYKDGVTAKQSFRLDEITYGGQTITIFADPEAPKFEAKTIRNADDVEVTIIVAADGSTPPPVPLPPPEPPAAETPPAAVVPAPATPATPAPATTPAAPAAAPK